MSVIFGTTNELKKWRPILEQEYKSAYEQAKKEFDLKTKRADYAAMCLQGILSNHGGMGIHPCAPKKAVEFADLLLEELSKERE